MRSEGVAAEKAAKDVGAHVAELRHEDEVDEVVLAGGMARGIDGAAGYAAERAWQSHWLAERLGLRRGH